MRMNVIIGTILAHLERALLLFLWVVIGLLLLGLFSQAVHNRSDNEEMYVAAAVLISQGHRPYVDFAFVQTPYFSFLLAAIIHVAGEWPILLTAKIVNYLFLVIGVLIFYATAAGAINYAQAADRSRVHTTGKRIDRLMHGQHAEHVLAAALSVLLLATHQITRITIEASNYTMPFAFSLASLYFFLALAFRPQNPNGSGGQRLHEKQAGSRARIMLSLFLSGFFLALAVGSKLYYVTLATPFLVNLLQRSGGWRVTNRSPELVPKQPGQYLHVLRNESLWQTGAWLGGLIVGLLPLLWIFIRFPRLFIFNNLGFHQVTAAWRRSTGYTYTLDWATKLDFGWHTFSSLYYLLPLSALVAAFLLWFQSNTRRKASAQRRENLLLLFLLLALFSLATAFIPRPLFLQYFAMPLPFILLLVGLVYGMLYPIQQFTLRYVLVLFAFVATVNISPRHTNSLRDFFDPNDRWSSWTVAEDGERMRKLLREKEKLVADQNAGKVATLSPITALEGKLPIYPELATGAFMYRIGDLLTEQERLRYRTTSVSRLTAFLNSDPPCAIYIRKEEAVTAQLMAYALNNGYARVDAHELGGILFIQQE